MDRLREWGTEAQGTHRRAGAAGQHGALEGQTGDTLRSPTVSTTLQRLAAQAVEYPAEVCTHWAYLIDEDFLRAAYRRTRKESAAGIERVTAKEYGEPLDENLRDGHERLRSGRYTAPPVERVWLDKEEGRKRPLGKPTVEDKSVQRAVAMLVGAI